MRICVIPLCQLLLLGAPGAHQRRGPGAQGSAGSPYRQQTQEDEHGRRPSHGPCQAQENPVLRRHRRRHRLGAGVAVGDHGGRREAPRRHGTVPKTSPASSWTFTPATATPIKHLVVIFDENVSFDHYFGTYPFAANTDGTAFHAKRGTPTVNGLYTKITPKGPAGPLLTSNPNLLQPRPAHPLPGADVRPEPRLHRRAEGRQQRQDGPVRPEHRDRHLLGAELRPARPGDGLLRRQHGHRAVELRAELRDERQQLGHHVRPVHTGRAQPDLRPDRRRVRGRPEDRGEGGGPGQRQPAEQRRPGHRLRRPRPRLRRLLRRQPHLDEPARRRDRQERRRPAQRQGNHLGLVPGRLRADRDQLGAASRSAAPSSTNIGGVSVTDYSPHHNPFEYYKSTANPKHMPPSSEAAIGHTDQANHQYDLSDSTRPSRPATCRRSAS